MSDIFNRETDSFAGAFPVDRAKISLPGLGGLGNTPAGLIIQNMSIQYTQQISRIYQATSSNVYYVGGRTAGNGSIQSVAGPRRMSSTFYRTYGDVCNARTNTIHISATAGCDLEGGGQARAAFTAHFVVLTAVSIQITAQDMLINEGIQFMFSSLLYDA
jgi:hypothetical protein